MLAIGLFHIETLHHHLGLVTPSEEEDLGMGDAHENT